MAFRGDPHTILGLPPDASIAEVKRAYRRLAKAFHPDTAGEAAIPRFLAIQAAYDRLTGDLGGRRGAAGSGGTSRAGSAGSGSAGPGGSGGRRPGWWADPERARASRGRRPADAPGGERSRARRGGQGFESAPGAGPRSRRGDRQPGRATPGSTTYDEVDVDPFDPEWAGGSWYGTSSGTYWTINPKEYADPRKHGPEYQARARRAERPAGDWASSAPGAAEEDPGEDEADGGGIHDATGPGGEAAEARESPDGGATRAEPATPWRRPADRRPPPRPVAASPAGSPSRGNRPAPAGPAAPAETAADPLAALPLPDGSGRRIAVALLGWPPLGIAIAWILGELSGCGRFAAGCVETFAVGTWVAQFAVLGVLLLLPVLAAASAVGTLAALAAAIPASILLSAVGGAREPEAAGGALAVVLGIAWLAGAAFAVGRRSRNVPP